MAEGSPEDTTENTPRYSEDDLSDEVKALAAKGRGEVAEEPKDSPKERPENVPEKFWDAEAGAVNQEALLKSYLELEKARSKPKEDEPKDGDIKIGKDKSTEGKSGADDDEEETPQFSPEAVTETVASVRDRYAQTGELTDDDRKALNDVGFDDGTIDAYMAGIKAVETQMRNTAFSLAGDEDTYRAAVKWAQENWSEEEIEAYDRDLSNPKLLGRAVKSLVNDYKSAVPDEGNLRGGGNGAPGGHGDTYETHEEFQADLKKADAANDPVARRKAIDKLRRSREANSLKTAPNRNIFDSF